MPQLAIHSVAFPRMWPAGLIFVILEARGKVVAGRCEKRGWLVEGQADVNERSPKFHERLVAIPPRVGCRYVSSTHRAD